MIGLRNGAPAAAAAKQGHDVIVIAYCREIEEQRRLSLYPQRQCRQHRTFDAMRTALPQYFSYRQHRVAFGFEIGRHGVQERLDSFRRAQAFEGVKLGAGEAERRSPGKTLQHPGSVSVVYLAA